MCLFECLPFFPKLFSSEERCSGRMQGAGDIKKSEGFCFFHNAGKKVAQARVVWNFKEAKASVYTRK
jgi:hypothetical protein